VPIYLYSHGGILLLPPMGIENGGLEIIVSKPPFGVRFCLERDNR